MEDRETARMRKYGESKTTRIMMATVPHVTSGLGLRKFQADGFLLTRVYNLIPDCLLYLPYLLVKMQRLSFSLTVGPNIVMYMMLLTIHTAVFYVMNFFYSTNNAKSCFVLGKSFYRSKYFLKSRGIYLHLLLQLCSLYGN